LSNANLSFSNGEKNLILLLKNKNAVEKWAQMQAGIEY